MDNPYLAHHFETPVQQYDSGKLGMWLFLATEILLFGGLFCAYTAYRANHPELFVWGHKFLDVNLGAFNTVVLLFSSLTMAWGVRCAQLGQRRGLMITLGLTLVCGGVFMGVKTIEYSSKIKHGLEWGKYYHPDPHYLAEHERPGSGEARHLPPVSATADSQAASVPAAFSPASQPLPSGLTAEPCKIPPPAVPPAGLYEYSTVSHETYEPKPLNGQIFFGIYYAMTGLHGIHVLVGMGIIAWLLVRSWRGEFSGAYFTPVDLGGLYWHLVDVIWIFLFPLLYLIH